MAKAEQIKMFPEDHLKTLTEDPSKLQGPSSPRWMRDMILYQVYLRNLDQTGTFKSLVNRLDSIKELGATAIWLAPIHPIGQAEKKGTLGCPYSIADYFDVNPEYGTREDFRHLVESVHEKDMRIFIDFVANHTAHDHVMAKREPSWFYRDALGKHTRRRTEWSDVIDVNYDNADAWDYMKKVALHWLEEFDLDGYRCDVAGMVPIGFWEETTALLRRIKPDFYMLAEWDESPHLCSRAFNSDYKGDHYLLMQEVNRGKQNPRQLVELTARNYSRYPSNNLPLNFIENHDQPRACHEFGVKGFRPWAVFIFTIPGIPLIYNGQEIGQTRYLSLFEKEPIDWSQGNEEIKSFYQNLAQIRKDHFATRDGQFIPLKNDNPRQIATYQVKTSKDQILTALNLTPKTATVTINTDKPYPQNPKPILQEGLKLIQKEKPEPGTISMKLDPYGFALFG